MNRNEVSRLFYRDELDPTVRAALEDMLSQSPNDPQLESSMGRLRRLSQPLIPTGRMQTQQHGWRIGITAAASFMLCVLWLGAQTETWGRVAQDLQRTSARELADVNAATSSQSPIDQEKPASPGLRFVLILHVFGLLIGLAGMLATWVCSVWHWLIALWRQAADRRPAAAWCRSVHLSALIAYGCGIAFGCLWSQATWGGPWKWDPREAFALITLGIGTVWYTSSKVNHNGDSIHQAICEALIASLSILADRVNVHSRGQIWPRAAFLWILIARTYGHNMRAGSESAPSVCFIPLGKVATERAVNVRRDVIFPTWQYHTSAPSSHQFMPNLTHNVDRLLLACPHDPGEGPRRRWMLPGTRVDQNEGVVSELDLVLAAVALTPRQCPQSDVQQLISARVCELRRESKDNWNGR